MSVVGRLWRLLVAVGIAVLGLSISSGPVSAVPPVPTPIYTYAGYQHAAPRIDVTTERGPPASDAPATFHGAAADELSRGPSPRIDGPTPLPIYDYNHGALLVQVGGVATTTKAQVRRTDGESVSHRQAGVAAKGATAEIDASKLTMTKTVEQHLTEYAKDGTLARPYGDSRLTIQEIMRSGDPVPDPGGVPGALRWDAPGAFGKSSGTWELVVNPETNTILHFLFRSGQ